MEVLSTSFFSFLLGEADLESRAPVVEEIDSRGILESEDIREGYKRVEEGVDGFELDSG